LTPTAVMPYIRFTQKRWNLGLLLFSVFVCHEVHGVDTRPNIIWIVAEDASAHLGCYGETTIHTPNIDALAGSATLFRNAFVTSPVCSPSRSAMVTGMYPSTLGAHQHRSQRTTTKQKNAANEAYHESFRLPVKSVPELFRDAGYFTSLGKHGMPGRPGKRDYNFIEGGTFYDSSDWGACPKDRPLFAQILLRGGKNRKAKHSTDPGEVKLPPYYPDHPTLREDWANYLNSWVQMDVEVGEILKALDASGRPDRTFVFFWTDHGVSHMRGKQFLYEEGIRVPLIVRSPKAGPRGVVRKDLVLQIDVSVTSLSLSWIPVPSYMQGRQLFADGVRSREIVFTERDRCDETVDIIRSARTSRYKYIRNFLPHVSHAQPSRYKDGKKIIQEMRALHARGELNELQARVFRPSRPAEELSDLEEEPHETRNLAAAGKHGKTLERLRSALHDRMAESRDLGLIPESLAEELGKKYGNKYFILKAAENKNLVKELIAIVEDGERGDRRALLSALASPRAFIRYWAETGLGNLGDPTIRARLEPHLSDDSAGVRVAAALALCKLGHLKDATVALIRELNNENTIVGMYAARAIERSGIDTPSVRRAVKSAVESPYEFTRRIAHRLTKQFSDG
jgi:arylsulfatase A-like enzyme